MNNREYFKIDNFVKNWWHEAFGIKPKEVSIREGYLEGMRFFGCVVSYEKKQGCIVIDEKMKIKYITQTADKMDVRNPFAVFSPIKVIVIRRGISNVRTEIEPIKKPVRRKKKTSR
jgi:hypothetical protein